MAPTPSERQSPPSPDASGLIGQTIGRYRILAKLGQGGMATVWRAEDTLLRRPVALKLLSSELAQSPEAEQRFLREARAASSLDHPSAVAVYDAGRAGDRLYIAFACIEGETVSDRAARMPFTHDESVRMGIAVADALAQAHGRGIVHRDITGRNIMIDQDDRVFILDFGLAFVVGASKLTRSDATLGTWAYLSPEVAGGGGADARSDLYGLGVVLYEALTGVLPFHGESPASVLYAIMHTTPSPPRSARPDIDSGMEAIVLRLLAKDPDSRFQSALELTTALRSRSGPEAARTSPTAGGSSAERTRASGFTPQRRPAPSLPERPYLAVLPFEDLGSAEDPAGERAVFARGLAGALSAGLGSFAGIRLVPVPGNLSHTPTDDLEGLARSLGANLLLRGTVRRAGTQLRITYVLLHPYRRVQVGGETLEGSTLELFDLEDRLVQSVLRTMGLGREHVVAARPRATRDPAAHERYIQALGYLQRFEDEAHVDAALTLLDRLGASEPGSAPIHAAIGRACLFKYRLTAERSWQARAATACQSALELDPTSPEVLLTLGDLRVSTGGYSDAVDLYERSLAARSGQHEALIGMAKAYEGMGRFAEAERCCARAIEARPGYWGAHEELGLLLFRQGRWEESLEPWRKVVALTPDNYRGYQNLGTTYFNLSDFDEALLWNQRSIDVHPNPAAFSNLGTILYSLGRYEEAAHAFRRATALRPSDPLLWGNLGGACVWVPGLRAEAREHLERAVIGMQDRLDRNPHHGRDWVRLAGWLANLERHDEAREAVRRGLGLCPDDVAALAFAGIIYHQAGDRRRAMLHLRQAVRRGYGVDLLEREPYLTDLRDDQEFKALVMESPRTRGGRVPPDEASRSPKEEGRDSTEEA
jgi:tetratricopeptide (TPR) repeat protein/TolB-like protein